MEAMMIRQWVRDILTGFGFISLGGPSQRIVPMSDREAIASDWKAVGVRGAMTGIDRTLSPMDRDRLLQQATRQYVNDEITMEQYHDARQRYGTDWDAVLRAIGKRQRST